MKKLLVFFILAALLLCGCSQTSWVSGVSSNSLTQTEKVKDPSPQKLKEYRKIHSSDERNLVVSYRHGACGYGCQYEFFTIVYDVYNDGTLEFYGAANDVPEEQNCCKKFTLDEKQYNDIIDYIETSRLDRKSSVRLSSGNCDDVSYYMMFYLDGKMYKELGGYAASDKKFNKLAQKIKDCITDEDYSQLKNGFEENYKAILENKDSVSSTLQNTDIS